MVRLALLSFWHVHAADYAAESAAHPEVELAAVWDEHPERGRLEAGARGVPFVPDLDAVLRDPSIDGVIVTTATTAHRDVVGRAAAAGKHVFMEKVIAPTLAESLAIVAQAERAGIVLSVALSRAVEPATEQALELIGNGAIGEPTAARARFAHDGALPTPDRPSGWLPERFFQPDESAGGALIDLGAHPLYLTRLFLGMPDRVTAVFGRVTGRGVDDNAAALFGYERGAVGVAETGFVSRGGGSRFEVSGTEGGLAYARDTKRFTVTRGDRREAIELPHDAPTPFARWVEAVGAGRPMPANVKLALELSALAEAATLSAESGRTVALSELDGWDQLVQRGNRPEGNAAHG